jgi:hypothetical protein
MSSRPNSSSKKSYLQDVTEEKIQDEKAKLRCDHMMKQLNILSLKNQTEPQPQPKPQSKSSSVKYNTHLESINEKSNGRSSSDDSSSDDEDENGPKRFKAPTELKEEFLVCLMRKEWQDAYKLCKFILMFEPHNKEANDFLPLIEYKLSQSSDDEDDDESETSDSDENEDEEESSSNDENEETDEEEKN